MTEYRCGWKLALSGLTAEEISLIDDKMRKDTYCAGEFIFHFGDPADSLLIVRSGRIKCTIPDESGKIFIPAVYGPDGVTGVLSSLLGLPRMVSAIALETTQVGTLREADVEELMGASPKFAKNIAGLAAAMASDLINTMSSLALESAKKRLGAVLLGLGVPVDPSMSNSKFIVRGYGKEDIANMVGVTRTWVSLMLSRMERSGLIVRQNRNIIFDKAVISEWLVDEL